MNYYRIINGKRYEASLLNSAEFYTRGKGDGRISEEEARILWRQALDGGRLTETEERTLVYLMENFNFTEKAKDVFQEALSEEQEKLVSYYQVIDGLRYDRKILVEAEKRTQGQGDGKISFEDAKDLWEFAQDAGDLKVEEKRSIQRVMELYHWTDKAKEWFLARMGEISQEVEADDTLMEQFLQILQKFGVPGLTLEYKESEITRQSAYPSNVLPVADALTRALGSLIHYNGRPEGGFQTVVFNVTSIRYDEDIPEAVNAEFVRILSTSHLVLVPDESSIPEDDREYEIPGGESLTENWIFALFTQLSDHVFYIIVDRSGEKDAFNYAFN